MSVCVCVCVCVSVCLCVCVHACMRVCMRSQVCFDCALVLCYSDALLAYMLQFEETAHKRIHYHYIKQYIILLHLGQGDPSLGCHSILHLHWTRHRLLALLLLASNCL